MKMIMRADDLGLSEGVNYGIRKAVDEGVIRSVGLMTNMPYAKHGYELIKDYDIAIGLHCCISSGKPLTSPQQIPSLVENDRFYKSHVINNRKIDSVDIDEAIKEVEAQYQQFIKIVKRKPDYIEAHAVESEHFYKAISIIAKKYDLLFGVSDHDDVFDRYFKHMPLYDLDEKNMYNPMAYFHENIDYIRLPRITIAYFHPGYLDWDVIQNSSYQLIRPMECQFVISQEFKDWLKENDIECIDYRIIKEIENENIISTLR